MPDKNIGFSVGTGNIALYKKTWFCLNNLRNHDKTTPLSTLENIPPELAGQGNNDRLNKPRFSFMFLKRLHKQEDAGIPAQS